MNINDTFQGITTLIITSAPNGQSQATGFFYQKLAENKNVENGPHWRQVEKVWLITNRHVALCNFQGKETLPITFAFHLRSVHDNTMSWEPVVLSKEILVERAKFHPNSEVD